MTVPTPSFPPLAAHHTEALRDIVAWIRATIPLRAVLVSGSIIRGNPDAGSDLDIIVLNREPWRQRVQRLSQGVPCEVLINPLQRIRDYFASEHQDGHAVTAHMIATGWTILDPEGVMTSLQEEARTWLSRPPTSSIHQLTALRYRGADLIENALDVVEHDPATAAWLAGMAVEPILDYWLLNQARLVPRSKELLGVVSALDPSVGALVHRAWSDPDPRGRVTATADLAEHCLGVRGFFAWASAQEPC